MMSDEDRAHDPAEHERSAQPTEEELRARLEEELRRITVRDVLLQTVVSLVNLAGQRLGLGEGGAEARDLAQVRLAIEAVRALLPLVEEDDPEQMKPVRDALAQLQMAYAREAGGPPGAAGEPEGGGGPPEGSGGAGEAPPRPKPRRGEPGGLWVPPGSVS